MLPTIDEFLKRERPNNSWVRHPGFSGLYVRSGKVFIREFKGMCHPVLQIASIEASHPGQGAFVNLVNFLVERDLAIYVENVLNRRFAKKLMNMGFISVNNSCVVTVGVNFLFNHEGKIDFEFTKL